MYTKWHEAAAAEHILFWGGGLNFVFVIKIFFPPPPPPPPQRRHFFSDINQNIFPDIYKKGDEKHFSGHITKKIFRTYIFLNKILQIFPLTPKFSKNTLNFSLIIKIFPEKTHFFWGGG
jgi:hypothetical protein